VPPPDLAASHHAVVLQKISPPVPSTPVTLWRRWPTT
jgi:hypothetical protein